MNEFAVTRRTAVAGAGALALTGIAAAGCDSGGGTESGGGSEDLGTASDIPVGGGKVFGDAGVVVTQPDEGTLRAFSAECTHRGCTVEKVADGTINCGCHGSRFAIEDGSVVRGPAEEPLPKKQVEVGDDGKLSVA